jgi:hypothetical protein
MSLDLEDLSTLAAFRQKISGLVQRAMVYEPDLIVFPEYTAVFIALIPYYPAVAQSSNLLNGFLSIGILEPLIGSLHDLFLLNSGFVRRTAEVIFGDLAREKGVWIVGGTYFAWEQGTDGNPLLKNRAFVMGRDGEVLYTQDKVYLTEFETALLGLSAGRLEQAGAFQVRDRSIGLTICRDTFFTPWEEVMAGNDLWIDIKANGEVYSEAQQESFLRALPSRIQSGDVPFGLTVCLNGKILDLLWEGESSLVKKQGKTYQFLQKSVSARKEEILFFSLP